MGQTSIHADDSVNGGTDRDGGTEADALRLPSDSDSVITPMHAGSQLPSVSVTACPPEVAKRPQSREKYNANISKTKYKAMVLLKVNRKSTYHLQ